MADVASNMIARDRDMQTIGVLLSANLGLGGTGGCSGGDWSYTCVYFFSCLFFIL